MVRVGLLAALVALCAAAPASAQEFVLEGSFGSFKDARGLAVDAAGRVYVVDAGARKVEIYDRAQDGNKLLTTLPGDRVVRPVAVGVDNRQRIYVADAFRNVIEVFGSATERFSHRGTLGAPGQAPGQLDAPVALVTDPNLRVYALEAGNLRVSVFRPSGGRLPVFQSAFGLSTPEPVESPSAMARDSRTRLFVAGESTVRAVDRRGRFISTLGARFLERPRGVAVDRFDRLLISDAGTGRLHVLGPLPRGAQRLSTFSGLTAPGPASFAPGALVYVLDSGRVVRLRYDDADLDAVPDSRDNCLGLVNGDQANADRDAKGDACDSDDDEDGRLDVSDRCPTEKARSGDADGCRDVGSRFLVPVHRRVYAVQPQRVVGRSDGGVLGVESVRVAVARLVSGNKYSEGRQCDFLDLRARRFVRRACSQPLWSRASGTDTWRLVLPPGILPPGDYAVLARAQQKNGPQERSLHRGRNVREFSIRG